MADWYIGCSKESKWMTQRGRRLEEKRKIGHEGRGWRGAFCESIKCGRGAWSEGKVWCSKVEIEVGGRKSKRKDKLEREGSGWFAVRHDRV